MLADTTDARRGDLRKAPPPIFDTAVPHVRKRDDANTGGGSQGQSGSGSGPGSASGSGPGDGKLQFQLLSKRGNRQHMRALDIPMDSNIAMKLQTNQLQSQAERQQLKRLVLQNEARQGQSEMQGRPHIVHGRRDSERLTESPCR
jgi:regulator of nonsense transcripts 2